MAASESQWLRLSVVGKVDADGEHGHPSWSEDEAETSRHISDMFLFLRNFMAPETPFLLTTKHGSGAICGIDATKRLEGLRGSCSENSIPDFGGRFAIDARLAVSELTFPDPTMSSMPAIVIDALRKRFNPSIGYKRS